MLQRKPNTNTSNDNTFLPVEVNNVLALKEKKTPLTNIKTILDTLMVNKGHIITTSGRGVMVMYIFQSLHSAKKAVI